MTYATHASSTLLHRLTTQLELLLLCGQLQKAPFNEIEALRFLSNTVVFLGYAETPLLGRKKRYEMAHDGIYSLCLGAIYLQQLLPLDQDGNRSLVLQVAFELLELTVADLHRVLNADRRREEIACNPEAVVFENEVIEMVGMTSRALQQARRVYPDWFL
ncbi:MAG: hypothetical protein K9K38_08015 [Rhodoferax sp.]|nr:hypothetical protein [Rhodoferax sp.]